MLDDHMLRISNQYFECSSYSRSWHNIDPLVSDGLSLSPVTVPNDLTPEECQELENIRRRKQELLADIQVGCVMCMHEWQRRARAPC